MKVFISSVISGFDEYRDAAARACQTLRHQPLRAEDFGAKVGTPQQVCLAGVRGADIVVLILGAKYGEPQPSGFSATHEEFREARERSRVLAFVQEGVTREPRQEQFVKEAQQWGAGLYTASFKTAEELRDAVIEGLHREELARATGVVDEGEILKRALKFLPDQGRTFREPSLCVVATAGPRQQILRPAELDRDALQKQLMKEALLGDLAVLDPAQGSQAKVTGNQLAIAQDDNSLTIDQLGSVRIIQALRGEELGMAFGLALIEEDIQDHIQSALLYINWVWDLIDSTGKLTHAVPIVSILNAGYRGWKTREEQRRDPNRGFMNMNNEEAVTVQLTPPSRPRPALKMQAAELAEDFTTLLRREVKK